MCDTFELNLRSRYNTVKNGPHNCMLGGGNEGWPWGQGPETGYGSQCLFEGNTLDTCVYECGDCGAFYSCGQQGSAWINRGNILRNGVFKNIGSWSIYLDDQVQTCCRVCLLACISRTDG
jgi:hypothetical protein